MYGDDEEELELLRQYEGKECDESEDDAHSSDQMDSDLEDKIMSMVQYGSGLTKKKAPVNPVASEKTDAPVDPPREPEEPKVVHAPIDFTKSNKSDFSFSNELQLNDSDLEEETKDAITIDSDEHESDSDEHKEQPTTSSDTVAAEPLVTNYIDLNDQQPVYIDEEETSEEEAELNSKLQRLIEDQIYNRQNQNRHRFATQTMRVCFSCHQPGHDRKDCVLCMECGGPRHNDYRCTGMKYCGWCKERGHLKNECDNPVCTNNCRLCNMSYHNWNCCPSLLHRYTNERPPAVIPDAFCYHCTRKGHYGDECPMLPSYLEEMPSVFSKLSLDKGSRFDPKKFLKDTTSSFSRHTSNKHQKWSDSSRESSPRSFNGDRGKKRAKKSYDSDDSFSGNKKRRNDDGNSYKYKYTSTLDDYFDRSKNNQRPGKSSNKGNAPQKSGNSNWKAVKNNFLPQPTRSGTVNVNSSRNDKNQGYGGDFPRGRDLPQPTSSGVIDLTGAPSSNKRAPKYHGGYKRNR